MLNIGLIIYVHTARNYLLNLHEKDPKLAKEAWEEMKKRAMDKSNESDN